MWIPLLSYPFFAIMNTDAKSYERRFCAEKMMCQVILSRGPQVKTITAHSLLSRTEEAYKHFEAKAQEATD